MLYSRTLLCIHPVYTRLHLLILTFQPFPPPPPTPLVTTKLFSMSVSLFLFCIYIHLYYFLDSTYKLYHMIFVLV